MIRLAPMASPCTNTCCENMLLIPDAVNACMIAAGQAIFNYINEI
jgi:hypothetical protein